MAKKRTTRKQLLKGPDEFITQTGKAIRWARANTRPLIYGACALLAILVFSVVYSYYREQQEQAAYMLLSQSIDAYQKERAPDSDPAALLEAARPDFERLISKYGRYPAGRLGTLIFGHISLAGGDAQAAIKLYQKSLNHFGDDPSLSPAIINGMAEAYVQVGDTSSAIAQYEKLANGRVTPFIDVALFHLGRLYQIAGETEKSRKAYERLGTDFPDSMYADMAREKAAG
jgi:tetratricopeptide (TPR) repeat protein